MSKLRSKTFYFLRSLTRFVGKAFALRASFPTFAPFLLWTFFFAVSLLLLLLLPVIIILNTRRRTGAFDSTPGFAEPRIQSWRERKKMSLRPPRIGFCRRRSYQLHLKNFNSAAAKYLLFSLVNRKRPTRARLQNQGLRDFARNTVFVRVLSIPGFESFQSSSR